MREKILLKRGYLEEKKNDKNFSYIALMLLNKFGITVDNPKLLCSEHLKLIADFFGKDIPNGFYSNPQDLKYFSCEELLVEQLISYFSIENITGVNSTDQKSFDRIEVFKKVLPNYEEGTEVKTRLYQIVSHKQSEKILSEIMTNLSNYTREWSLEESNEYKWLYLNGYFASEKLLCKDNAITMLVEYKMPFFAKMLDKKDIVKLSLFLVGDKKCFSLDDDKKIILELALNNCYDFPLSKKQAKYFNTIAKKLGVLDKKTSNINSPYKKAKRCMENDDVIGASKIFAENGSLLERNLVWLLSRANLDECRTILNMMKPKNPIVLIQLLQSLESNSNGERVFKFYKNKRLKHHVETDYECKYRKSILSNGIKKEIANVLNDKIKEYYQNLDSLGKIFVNEEFKNVALPINTSAMGGGLDILPTGSRLKITEDYIRTFCYWHNVYDIDASIVFVKEDETRIPYYWGTYAGVKKQFGNSALFSGDDRSDNGAEYIDFKIKELKNLGFKYAIFSLNGFNGDFNSGEIYCGYQNKKNLNTKVWSEKNIELKISVKGNSRAYIGFAVDFDTNEIVIINQILNSGNMLVDDNDYNAIKHLLSRNFLNSFNVYKMLSYRGELVKDIETADYVFDSTYEAKENQQVIKPIHVEKLVSLLK